VFACWFLNRCSFSSSKRLISLTSRMSFSGSFSIAACSHKARHCSAFSPCAGKYLVTGIYTHRKPGYSTKDSVAWHESAKMRFGLNCRAGHEYEVFAVPARRGFGGGCFASRIMRSSSLWIIQKISPSVNACLRMNAASRTFLCDRSPRGSDLEAVCWRCNADKRYLVRYESFQNRVREWLGMMRQEAATLGSRCFYLLIIRFTFAGTEVL
jgi:hypothetical protein